MKYAWVTKRKCCFQRAGSFHPEQRDAMNKWRATFTPNMQRVAARLYLHSQKRQHSYWIVRFLSDQSGNCFGRHLVIRWKNQWSMQTDRLRCVPFGEHLRSRVRKHFHSKAWEMFQRPRSPHWCKDTSNTTEWCPCTGLSSAHGPGQTCTCRVVTWCTLLPIISHFPY